MSPLTLLALFGAGVLSFASPCVLPLVPVWAGIAMGEAATTPAASVRATAWFVAGFAAVFVVLGAAAAEVGGWLSTSGAWLPRLGGAAVAGFGLVMIGVAHWGDREVRLLHAVPRWASGSGAHLGVPRAVVAGVAFGAAWTPCVGPLLGSALVVAGGSARPAAGAALLAAYSFGIGLPFLLAALALASWPDAQRRLAPWSPRLRLAGGVLLLVTGVALAVGATDRLLSPAARLLPA